jgi:Flp pilus assembly protein TadD
MAVPKTAEELVVAGNAAFVDEDFEAAVGHYTAALAAGPHAEARTKRAAAYLKLNKFAEAAVDAEEAVKLSPESVLALHHKG